MVIDTLSGRSPLYHLESFFEDKDTEVLLGEAVDASLFNDDNAGAVLDLLYEVGTQKIYSEVAMAALRAFEVSTEHVHFDTTSVSLYGDYLSAAGEDSPLQITHGFSKDKRPGLKQFVLSMLCVGGNVPIIGQCQDGNASDKRLNNALLSTISKRLKACGVSEQAFTYVADSALVTQDNLAALGEEIRFITRLPASYSECERVIRAAVEANQWETLGRIAQTAPTKHRPGAYYRLWEAAVTLYGQRYRAVVVHSSAHDRRRQKRLQRELEASEQSLRRRQRALHKQRFFMPSRRRGSGGQSPARGRRLSPPRGAGAATTSIRPRPTEERWHARAHGHALWARGRGGGRSAADRTPPPASGLLCDAHQYPPTRRGRLQRREDSPDLPRTARHRAELWLPQGRCHRQCALSQDARPH
jgi:transposase